MAGANSIKFAVWSTLPGGQRYNAKIVCFGKMTIGLCKHENCVFFFHSIYVHIVWNIRQLSPAFVLHDILTTHHRVF